jgi:hypothetical protein
MIKAMKKFGILTQSIIEKNKDRRKKEEKLG